MKYLTTIGLACVTMLLGTCAFWYEPPLDKSAVLMYFDFPHVHNWPSMVGAMVVALGAVYHWRKRP